MLNNTTVPAPESKASVRPRYETPRIKAMSEREILNTFQLTQSMAAWWVTASMR